jgi:hypothetical protein
MLSAPIPSLAAKLLGQHLSIINSTIRLSPLGFDLDTFLGDKLPLLSLEGLFFDGDAPIVLRLRASLPVNLLGELEDEVEAVVIVL